jgi:hypothetical protein
MTTPTPTRRSLLGALFAALFAGLFGKKCLVAAPAQQSASCDSVALATDVNASTIVFSASGLPAGLSINANTGSLSGSIDGSGRIVCQ